MLTKLTNTNLVESVSLQPVTDDNDLLATKVQLPHIQGRSVTAKNRHNGISGDRPSCTC